MADTHSDSWVKQKKKLKSHNISLLLKLIAILSLSFTKIINSVHSLIYNGIIF